MRNLEDLKFQMKIEPEEVSPSLENFIKEYMDKLEREGVILGLSGGVDSAVIVTGARIVGAAAHPTHHRFAGNAGRTGCAAANDTGFIPFV